MDLYHHLMMRQQRCFSEVRRFGAITFTVLEVLVHLHRFCRVESEQKAKGMMAQGFKRSDSQWEYAYRCFELMNLDILAHMFSADGVLKRGS